MIHFTYMDRAEAEKKVDILLQRGIETIVDPDQNFRNKLIKKLTGEYTGDIVIKFGVDPTRPDIHIGHAVVLKTLRSFQDIGCKIIFLIGDFTARIGDPTGKSKVRPELDQKEIEYNMKTYLDQVGKILKTDEKLFSWIRNSDWFVSPTDISAEGLEPKINEQQVNPNSFLGKAIIFEKTRMQATHLKNQKIETVSFSNVLWTLRHITHSRLIERDMFQERINQGESLFMHEMMYPVMQGIDSAILHKVYGACDLEVGGTDQTFNMLMGRDVMKLNNQEEQAVIAFKLLVGTDGKEKMSKSTGNYISITDAPSDMFGKIMSIPDNVMKEYFELVTYTPLSEIEEMFTKVKNPKDLKMRLAREVVSIYHGEEKAKGAEEDFENTFSKKEIPSDIETFEGRNGDKIGDILVSKEFIPSKSEWRRLIEDGGVTDLEANKKLEDFNEILTKDITLKIGKHRFVKIKIL